MRLLIFGAGVIGSFYAALFAEAGYETAVYARGGRLAQLRADGLRYETQSGVRTASITVLDAISAEDIYDYIFITVRENQLGAALRELADNQSPNLVTMVNSLESYEAWEKICGAGRIIPAFPGAGGGFADGVLRAALTPRIVQPTTFAEISGKRTPRAGELKTILKRAGIPCQVVPDMHLWQLCHLAMVVPLADAYGMTEHPESAGRDRNAMGVTAVRLKDNFRAVHKNEGSLSPFKMNLFRFLPVFLLCPVLGAVYRSGFGNLFMYQHAMNAPDEMRQLHEQFYAYLGNKKETKRL